MSFCEMFLEAFIVFIVHVLVLVTAEMASEMNSAQMIMELYIIEKEFLTEVTPRVRKNLCPFIGAWISTLYVFPQVVKVIYSLFAYKDSTAFQTNFTKSFLMLTLQMAP